ncbi:MAG: T9SS type A sorting domain-containing protein [Ignavibacteriaceae bacterium]
MKKILVFTFLVFTITLNLFAQNLPGFIESDSPQVNGGKHFKHIATSGTLSGNWTTIDNPATNGNPDAKLFITHNYGDYNNHVNGLWYNTGTSKWTIFNQDSGVVPIVANSEFHILVADESQSTVFQHTAASGNIISNWTVITHPALDGKPNAKILVTQILISSAGNKYNNHEIGVWYDGTKWGIFNEDLAAMPVGASFNILVLDDVNSFVQTATSGNIIAATTVIDNPFLNNNPTALVYVTQNYNPGGGSGTYNTAKVGTYYSTTNNKWTIFNEDHASMVENSMYNVYFGSPYFVHKTNSLNISSDLTKVDNPLINLDADAKVFALHTWNPFGSGTTLYDKKLGFYHDGSIWGIYTEDDSDIPENIYFNLAIAPKTDSAFLHTTSASNITSNYTIIDNPLLNGYSDAKLLVQHIFKGSRYNVNLGVWYNGNNWTIFTEDGSTMPEAKDFNVWLLNDNKSFVHTVDSANNIGNPSYSYIDNPLTNNNPDANILVTAILKSSPYHDHVQGVWYSSAAAKWVLYNEDISAQTIGAKYIVYVANSSGLPTSVDDENNSVAVNNFELQQNFPNPFNPTTQIRFSLAEQSQVTLKVYNILGKEIATLVNDVKGAGVHEVSFNGTGLASGVYFYTLQTGKFTQTNKMILVK